MSALAFVLVACGQKPGVHVQGGGQVVATAPNQGPTGGSQSVTETGATTSQGGAADDMSTSSGSSTSNTATSNTATSGSSTGGSSTGGSSTGSTGSSSTGSSTGTTTGSSSSSSGDTAPSQQPNDDSTPQGTNESSSGSQREVRGSDRTGVTDDKITFGLHAPVTGAAPLPSTSFEKSGDLYWRNLIDRQGGDVLGRTEIEMIFRDDKYDPNSARQVCRELESVAFTLGGGGGTDQIQACGQFAQIAEFPYFSAGVTEAGLRGNPWYFAASMSYKQQGVLLAQFASTHEATAGRRTAAIVTDTPNFDDAVEGWEQGVNQYGVDYYRTLRHPKGDTSWYAAFAAELQENDVEVVYILSSPVDYIRFAQKATEQGADFQYIGVGVSMGLNAVLGSGCDFVDDGIFFSPFPGLDWAREHTPEFFESAQEFGVPDDDIAYALWGINATNHYLLEQYGKTYGNDLTREDFRDFVETQRVESGIFPPVSFTPNDHFGAEAVHVLQANCQLDPPEYETIATFASSF